MTKVGSGIVNGRVSVKDFEFEYAGFKFIADVDAYADILVYISVQFWGSHSYYEQDSSETTIEDCEIRDVTDLSDLSNIRVYSLDNPTEEIELTDEIVELLNTEEFDEFLVSKLNETGDLEIVDEDELDTSDISVDDYEPDYDDYDD